VYAHCSTSSVYDPTVCGHVIYDNLFNPSSLDGANWDPTLMTSGPVFPDFDDQFANAGNAFVFPLGNLLGDEPIFASLSAPHVAAPITGPAAPPTAPTQPPQRRFPCTQACVETFTCDADRVRHERSTHFAQHGAHRCPIAGCPKSYGAGYSRPDKVKEHLRKKHGAQGRA
jgi:hypothetical protein